jgi:integrase
LNRATRNKAGSVVFDKRRKTWNWFYYEAARRRSKLIGTKQQYPTKAAARRAAEAFHRPPPAPDAGPTVRKVLKAYMKEKMAKRFSTRRAYRSWLRNHILPKWGGRHLLIELQPRPVKRWLDGLTDLTPKSRAHIKGLLGQLWEFAMFAGWVPREVNPMKLVHVEGASKRRKRPRSLTVEEFRRFIDELVSFPVIRVIAIVCGCLGLRISETLALRWSDLDCLRGRLLIERGIVSQHEDDVKTECSERPMPIDPSLLNVLLSWKLQTEFTALQDYMFASPMKLGRLPVSYPWVWRAFQNAADRAGIPRFGVHTLRHSYRSWLDAVGTELAVQQKLMRHADIRTTMSYGDVVTNQESDALAKITAMTLGTVDKQHATARGKA